MTKTQDSSTNEDCVFSLVYNNRVRDVSYTLEEFQKEATTFAFELSIRERATVVALHGDLGAGKTTFAQSMARALGITESVVSPTFLIQKRYSLEGQVFSNVIHIDAYRLKSAEQLEVLDWEELTNDPSNLILIEWPENITDLLAPETKHIYFEYIDEVTRSISYAQ
ncbi:MAG: tRNA (adenosine(37)-N6)-threonylcarbamoyltransferase complex ATPase subunit type 1 TsaE [Candidatus Pacebacteria bacterium]|nr:tRNA (adenosine(37)-N6)-threonylcarbamoyltransferase complex ATPase subunit type 1 TsaE [Candidatus Paceibacterota bacterium]